MTEILKGPLDIQRSPKARKSGLFLLLVSSGTKWQWKTHLMSICLYPDDLQHRSWNYIEPHSIWDCKLCKRLAGCNEVMVDSRNENGNFKNYFYCLMILYTRIMFDQSNFSFPSSHFSLTSHHFSFLNLSTKKAKTYKKPPHHHHQQQQKQTTTEATQCYLCVQVIALSSGAQ